MINHDTEKIVKTDTIYILPYKPIQWQIWQGEGYFKLVAFVVEATGWRTRRPDKFSTVYPAKKWLLEKEFLTKQQLNKCTQ